MPGPSSATALAREPVRRLAPPPAPAAPAQVHARGEVLRRHHAGRRVRRDQHGEQPSLSPARDAPRAHRRQRDHERAVAARSHRRAPASAAGAGRPRAPRRDRGLQPQEPRPLVRDRGRGPARRAARGQALLLPEDQPAVRASRGVPAHAGPPRARHPRRVPHRDALPFRPLRKVARGPGGRRAHHLSGRRSRAASARRRRAARQAPTASSGAVTARSSSASSSCAQARTRATCTGERPPPSVRWSCANERAKRAPTSCSRSTRSGPRRAGDEWLAGVRATHPRRRVARRRAPQARRSRRGRHHRRVASRAATGPSGADPLLRYLALARAGDRRRRSRAEDAAE